MIAPHATPAAAYVALGEFLTEDAPPLVSVTINNEHDFDGPVVTTYAAGIHVMEAELPAWMERHGFTEADVQRGVWTDSKDVLRVTSRTGVTIYALTDKATDGGAS